MKPLLMTTLLASLMLTFSAPVSIADENDEKPAVKYKHDFEGQDLTKRDFSKQNLDNANFADADLTDTNFQGASLKNCNFRGAVLRSTTFYHADLTGSDLRDITFKSPSLSGAILNKANLSGVDLGGINVNELKFREAILRNTKGFGQIYRADFYKADVRGADFSTATNDFDPANFRQAKSDQYTRWYDGFDVKARGLTVVVTEDEPGEDDAEEMSRDDDDDAPNDDDEDSEKPAPKPRRKSSPKKSNDEAAFQKLDINEDGSLSGKEKKGYEDRDADDDGEVTLAEFLAGASE